MKDAKCMRLDLKHTHRQKKKNDKTEKTESQKLKYTEDNELNKDR